MDLRQVLISRVLGMWLFGGFPLSENPVDQELGVQFCYAVPGRLNVGSGNAFPCGHLFSHR
jgi:hypothetical protein